VVRLAAARVVTPAGVVGPAEVVVDQGRIVAVEPAAAAVPSRTLVPGFVDLQVNGLDTVDVAAAEGAGWDTLDRCLLAQGTTTWCPTLVTAPLDSYGARLDRIAAAVRRPPTGPRPDLAGVHLEGPFLGGAPGAHDPALFVPVDRRWLEALPPIVRVITLAPEAAGAIEAIADLSRRGVVVGLGHSAASYDQAVAAVDAGARLVTHVFNGMGPFHHRAPGLAGVALTDDRVVASLIADNVHVHPAVLGLVARAKRPGGLALVTDAVAGRAGAAGPISMTLVDGVPRLADGTLAGTALTMDGAVRNLVAAGADLAAAVDAASTTPARLLGLTDRGAVAPGLRADLVALSPGLTVEAVWIGGRAAAGDT
jgi:N-acetylglucosamine-6-phosphate deacetylase